MNKDISAGLSGFIQDAFQSLFICARWEGITGCDYPIVPILRTPTGAGSFPDIIAQADDQDVLGSRALDEIVARFHLAIDSVVADLPRDQMDLLDAFMVFV